jgi:hypothetical protein
MAGCKIKIGGERVGSCTYFFVFNRIFPLLLINTFYFKTSIQEMEAFNVAVTRRSAGLPFAFVSILSNSPANLGWTRPLACKLIDMAGQEVVAELIDTMNLPQVHAFNVLR